MQQIGPENRGKIKWGEKQKMLIDKNALTLKKLAVCEVGNVKGFAVGGSIYWSTEKIVQACNLGNRGRRHHCFSGEESEIEGERVKEKRAEFEEEKVGCEMRRGSSLKRERKGGRNVGNK